MIKSIIKVLLITFLTLLIVIFYLSTFGIKTDKFNNQITSNIFGFFAEILILKFSGFNKKLISFNERLIFLLIFETFFFISLLNLSVFTPKLLK